MGVARIGVRSGGDGQAREIGMPLFRADAMGLGAFTFCVFGFAPELIKRAGFGHVRCKRQGGFLFFSVSMFDCFVKFTMSHRLIFKLSQEFIK